MEDTTGDITLYCILFAIICLLQSIVMINYMLTLSDSKRPRFCLGNIDRMLVTSKGEIYAIELTVCHEHNTTKAREYKEQRYRNLQDEIEIEYSVFKVVFIEITTLGLTPKTTTECKKLLKQFKVDYDRLFSKCCEVAIRTSYYIFCRRNKEWTHPLPLQYTT